MLGRQGIDANVAWRYKDCTMGMIYLDSYLIDSLFLATCATKKSLSSSFKAFLYNAFSQSFGRIGAIFSPTFTSGCPDEDQVRNLTLPVEFTLAPLILNPATNLLDRVFHDSRDKLNRQTTTKNILKTTTTTKRGDV